MLLIILISFISELKANVRSLEGRNIDLDLDFKEIFVSFAFIISSKILINIYKIIHSILF